MKAKNTRYMDWAKSQLKLIYQEVYKSMVKFLTIISLTSVHVPPIQDSEKLRLVERMLDAIR